MAKSIPCVWFRHITATSFGSRSSRGQVDSQDGYRCEESIGREIFREDMGSPGGYHKADYVLHISSRVPDSEESESVSACCKDGLC
jgi:hypothetical protein